MKNKYLEEYYNKFYKKIAPLTPNSRIEENKYFNYVINKSTFGRDGKNGPYAVFDEYFENPMGEDDARQTHFAQIRNNDQPFILCAVSEGLPEEASTSVYYVNNNQGNIDFKLLAYSKSGEEVPGLYTQIVDQNRESISSSFSLNNNTQSPEEN